MMTNAIAAKNAEIDGLARGVKWLEPQAKGKGNDHHQELVKNLQLLGLESSGNKSILQARISDYITMNTGEYTDPIEDIDLNSLDFNTWDNGHTRK